MKKLLSLGLAAAVVLACVLVVGAAQQQLVLKDGRKLVGDVTRTEKGYQIKTPSGIVTEIAASDVMSIADLVTPTDEFRQRLSKIDAKNPDQLEQLAVWAMENNLLAEARSLLQDILKIKPDHENARLRLRLVESRLASSTRPATGPSVVSTRTAVKPPDGGLDLNSLLTEEDISRIRLLELRDDDNVIIEFRNNVLDKYVKLMKGQGIFEKPEGERAFRGWPRLRQAREIIDNTDRDNFQIRDDIIVKSDPKAMTEFKTKIWPVISKNCASANCHGSAKGAGSLRLLNVALDDNRILYTNFLILATWDKGGQIINRENRENSLLLQYGLPSNLAIKSHPAKVDSGFRSKDDAGYRGVNDWIKSLRWPFLPPYYRVTFSFDKTASAPAK